MESALNVLIANIMELQFNEEQVTVQCRVLALVRVVDGMLITQFVTPVISKGTKVSPAYAVVELIGILRSEK